MYDNRSPKHQGSSRTSLGQKKSSKSGWHIANFEVAITNVTSKQGIWYITCKYWILVLLTIEIDTSYYICLYFWNVSFNLVLDDNLDLAACHSSLLFNFDRSFSKYHKYVVCKALRSSFYIYTFLFSNSLLNRYY